MKKYTHSLALMQAVVNIKDDRNQLSYAMNRLLKYMMDNFANPLTYQDPNGRIITDNDKKSVSEELVLATREILKSSIISQKWLTLLYQTPPAFKEPVFIIAVIQYLLTREKIPADIDFDIVNHDGTFTELQQRYGTLIRLGSIY